MNVISNSFSNHEAEFLLSDIFSDQFFKDDEAILLAMSEKYHSATIFTQTNPYTQLNYQVNSTESREEIGCDMKRCL